MDVFCVIPFHCYETDAQSLRNIGCCRWPRGTSINDVQYSIKSGTRHPSCETCWKAEDSGIKSERQIHNSTMDWLLDKDIEQIKQDALKGNREKYMIKLYTSNLCNGLCVTCGPEASTAWQKKENQNITYMTQSIEDAGINWSKVMYLSLVGGEPLLEKQNWQLLHNLAQQNYTDIFVTVVTNASNNLDQSQIELLQMFPKLNLCVSIDGTEKIYEYMRYPIKWEEFTDNLKNLQKVTDNISASVMISNINIRFIDQTLQWLDNNNIPYLAKSIVEPEYYAPSAMSQEMIAEVLNKNPKHALYYLGDADSLWADSYLLEFAKQDIARQDQLKDIDIENYLGDWGSFFK